MGRTRKKYFELFSTFYFEYFLKSWIKILLENA